MVLSTQPDMATPAQFYMILKILAHMIILLIQFFCLKFLKGNLAHCTQLTFWFPFERYLLLTNSVVAREEVRSDEKPPFPAREYGLLFIVLKNKQITLSTR